MSLTKEQLEQSFKNKTSVELDDLVQLIEKNFGFIVTLEKKNRFSDDQRKKMTSKIFKDKVVLYQLCQAKKDREQGISTYSDCEEEFEKLLTEIDHKNKNYVYPTFQDLNSTGITGF